jgi:hypothetical protein
VKELMSSDNGAQRWSTKRTALVGALGGAVVGYLLLKAIQPTSAYTNDAYREGASAGYIARFAILGALAAILAARMLRPDHGTENRTILLYAAGLAVVLGLAVLPPVFVEKRASDQRRADVRSGASANDFRAGAIAGCADTARARLDAAQEAKVDVDSYCRCFVSRLLAGARDDRARLEALNARMRAGNPPRGAGRAAKVCAARAARR